MSERDSYDHGTPCWIDHSSQDPEAAAGFYSSLFGWESQDVMPPDSGGHYFMSFLGGREAAGFGEQQGKGAPATWNTYVAVDDAEEAVAGAATAGATPMGDPFDVFDAGRMAVLQDPTGAWFFLWQAGQSPGARIVNEPGAWCWAELATRDPERAQGFYGELFGWQTRPLADGDPYTLFHPAGEIGPDAMPMAGLVEMGADWPAEVPAHWGTSFAVSDTDATAGKAEELGAAVIMAPFDTPVGRTAVMSDPLGATFAFITLETP